MQINGAVLDRELTAVDNQPSLVQAGAGIDCYLEAHDAGRKNRREHGRNQNVLLPHDPWIDKVV
jgi:hypothetical protein